MSTRTFSNNQCAVWLIWPLYIWCIWYQTCPFVKKSMQLASSEGHHGVGHSVGTSRRWYCCFNSWTFWNKMIDMTDVHSGLPFFMFWSLSHCDIRSRSNLSTENAILQCTMRWCNTCQFCSTSYFNIKYNRIMLTMFTTNIWVFTHWVYHYNKAQLRPSSFRRFIPSWKVVENPPKWLGLSKVITQGS